MKKTLQVDADGATQAGGESLVDVRLIEDAGSNICLIVRIRGSICRLSKVETLGADLAEDSIMDRDPLDER
jgi:hypothetical protein